MDEWHGKMDFVTIGMETLDWDCFLSQSAKDKAVVRPLAERLRQALPP